MLTNAEQRRWTPTSTTNSKQQELVMAKKSKITMRRRLVALGVLMILFSVWTGQQWLQQGEVLERKETELKSSQMVLDEATSRHEELTYQINRLHDYDYIAEIARRDYFLTKDGEMIFKVSEK